MEPPQSKAEGRRKGQPSSHVGIRDVGFGPCGGVLGLAPVCCIWGQGMGLRALSPKA